MAKVFTTRIRHVRLSFSPFSAETMSHIGTVWLDAKLSRIRRAVDSTDSPAKPLSKSYARRKRAGIATQFRRAGSDLSILMKGRGSEVRDWRLTGRTLAAAKVKTASEDKVTIGFITAAANQIVTWQRRIADMWSNSPSDEAAARVAIRAALKQSVKESFRKTG
jgi:hypothetical protein